MYSAYLHKIKFHHKSLKYLEIYLPHFEKYKNVDRLVYIYKVLRAQAEEKKQYKTAAEYYSKLSDFLEQNYK